MKRVIVLSVGIIILITAIASFILWLGNKGKTNQKSSVQQPEQSTKVENWQSYSNSEYSFQYPISFQLVTLGNISDVLKSNEIVGETRKSIEEINSGGLLDKSDVGLIEKNDNNNKNIVSFFLTEKNASSLEDNLSQIRTDLKKRDPNFMEKQVVVGKDKLQGTEFSFNMEMPIEGQKILSTWKRTLFQNKDKYFDFGFSFPDDGSIDGSKYLNIYYTILNSFSFAR